jgi:putative Mg2+ transporter-C (MgtC) family protein
MNPLVQMSPHYFSDAGLAGALIIAAVLGGILGLERSLAGKHAGMRTYALVSLGSCLFSMVGTLASFQLSFMPGINPLGIAASIVVGIGFIGQVNKLQIWPLME